MFGPAQPSDRMVVQFTGAEGWHPASLTWGQQAIWQDMQDSGNQFSMGGRLDLPEGTTVEEAARRLEPAPDRLAIPALRMRLETGQRGPPVPGRSPGLGRSAWTS